MKNYLLPGAVLILAITQIPTMSNELNFNACTREARTFSRAFSGGDKFTNAEAINYCNGRS